MAADRAARTLATGFVAVVSISTPYPRRCGADASVMPYCSSQQPADFTVATYNIRTALGLDGLNSWPFRRPHLVETIRELDADMVALQEVRPAQLQYLRHSLREYDVFSVSRSASYKAEHLVWLLRNSRVHLQSWQAKWFSTTPATPSRSELSIKNRFALCVEVLCDEKPIVLVNTHLDERSSAARLEASGMLAKWFKEADVICGDMNCSPAGSDAAPLLKAGFKSALSTESTFHGFDSLSAQPQTIDHIWLGRNA